MKTLLEKRLAAKLYKRLTIQKAKLKFVNTMKKKYPDFTERLWANQTYRNTHPQGAVR
tara:strand:+ start:449 stop:622 length:174 start_codon:yes stop_codon:yes gene_type:complete